MSSEEDEGAAAPQVTMDQLMQWTVSKLKEWLDCRNLPRSGKKNILAKRVFRNMTASYSDSSSDAESLSDTGGDEPEQSFEKITTWHPVTEQDIPGLRREDIDNYFLYSRNPLSGSRKACRRMLKKGRKFAYEPEFFCPLLCNREDSNFVYFKAHIRASMKQLARQVEVTLVKQTGAIFKTYCPCKAGLSGHCSHAAAMLLKLCALRAPCTSRLCSWSQPGNLAKHFEPRVVSQIPFGDPEKAESAPQRPYVDVYSAGPCKDPDVFLQDIMSGLEAVNPGCVLFKTLSPSVSSCDKFTDLFETEFCISDAVDLHSCFSVFDDFTDNLHASPELLKLVDLGTRGQSSNPEWHKVRKLILTASNFELMLLGVKTNCAP